MFGFTKNNHYNKEECYKHIVNNLISCLKEEKIKTIGFVSSNLKESFLVDIVENLAAAASQKRINTFVMNACFDSNCASSLSEKSKLKGIKFIEVRNALSQEFEKELLKHKDSCDLVLVAINSITTKSEALEFAKVCKEIIIVEKCTKCYYSNYENMLLNFKTANIKPRGVITVS